MAAATENPPKGIEMNDIIKMIEELAKKAGVDGALLAISSIALLGLAMVAKGAK